MRRGILGFAPCVAGRSRSVRTAPQLPDSRADFPLLNSVCTSRCCPVPLGEESRSRPRAVSVFAGASASRVVLSALRTLVPATATTQRRSPAAAFASAAHPPFSSEEFSEFARRQALRSEENEGAASEARAEEEAAVVSAAFSVGWRGLVAEEERERQDAFFSALCSGAGEAQGLFEELSLAESWAVLREAALRGFFVPTSTLRRLLSLAAARPPPADGDEEAMRVFRRWLSDASLALALSPAVNEKVCAEPFFALVQDALNLHSARVGKSLIHGRTAVRVSLALCAATASSAVSALVEKNKASLSTAAAEPTLQPSAALESIDALLGFCAERETDLLRADLVLLRVGLELLNCANPGSRAAEGGSFWLSELRGLSAEAVSFARVLVLHPKAAFAFTPANSAAASDPRDASQGEAPVASESAEFAPAAQPLRRVGPFLWRERRPLEKELLVGSSRNEFYANAPDIPRMPELWRRAVAVQRGWRLVEK